MFLDSQIMRFMCHQVKFVDKEGESVASVDVPVDRYIFFAAEDANVDVPIVNKRRMCRNGCCTTCAVKVLEGKVSASHEFDWIVRCSSCLLLITSWHYRLR